MGGKFNLRFNKGPKLPGKLTKELFGDAAGGGSAGQRGPGSRKDRRRADRQSKKEARSGPPKSERKRRFEDAGRGISPPSREERPGKKQRRSDAPAARPRVGGSKFDELLPPMKKDASAGALQLEEEPEIALQRRLARQLGLKKGKKSSFGDEDGLDDLMEGGFSCRDANFI